MSIRNKENLIREKEEIKCHNIIEKHKQWLPFTILQKKMQTNLIWIGQKNPDHLYRILTIWGSESGKSNSMFNLISNKPDIDEIYLYAKDLNEMK